MLPSVNEALVSSRLHCGMMYCAYVSASVLQILYRWLSPKCHRYDSVSSWMRWTLHVHCITSFPLTLLGGPKKVSHYQMIKKSY